MLHKLIKSALILDPNKYQAQLLSQALQAAGVGNVKHYANAAEAMAALELLAPCILFLEADTPDQDGLAFTRAFRRSAKVRRRKVPVVLTAQGASSLTLNQATDAGANALLAKPIAPAQAMAAIKRMLDNPRAFIDGPSYVGPCRRVGAAAPPNPCPRRREEDRALERLERMAQRDEAISALVRDGLAACAGEEAAASRCRLNGRRLGELAAVLEDSSLAVAALLIERLLAHDAPEGLRAQGAIMFKALALYLEAAPDDVRRVQVHTLLAGLRAA